MHLRKLLLLTVGFGAMLAVAAFGVDGLKPLFPTHINAAQAAAAPPGQPGGGSGRTAAPAPLTLPALPLSGTVAIVELLPAPEQPARLPDVAGLLSARDGYSLTLQAGQVFTAAAGGAGGMAPGGPAQGIVVFLTAAFSTAAFSGTAEGQGLALPALPALPAVPLSGTVVTQDLPGLTISMETAGGTPGEPGGQALAVPALPALPLSGTVVTQGSQGVLLYGGAVRALPAPGGAETPSTWMAGTAVAGMAGLGQPVSQQVEVTDATRLYRDVTPPVDFSAGGHQTVQQVLAAATLDDLTGPVSVLVWGHPEGEQWVAEVIVIRSLPHLP